MIILSQIASVLIERRLSRPKKGVPSSWLKSSSKKLKFDEHLSAVIKHFTARTNQLLKFGLTFIVPLLPFAAIGLVSFFQRNLLMAIGGVLVQNIAKLKTRAIEFLLFDEIKDEDQVQSVDDSIFDRAEQKEGTVRRGAVGSISMPTFTLKSNVSSEDIRVNIHDYDKATRSSLWNKLNLRISAWRKQIE